MTGLESFRYSIMSKELVIGDVKIPISVIQGGMGVGVSLSRLAGNVAKCGGVGIISTAQIGFKDPEWAVNPIECNLKAIKTEIEKAKKIAASAGMVGVNIMVATKRYEDYVKAAVKAGADIIISGAGLPMDLPALVAGSITKIAPIVSSTKAFKVIASYWKKKYNKLPDLVVIEGPKAGGHLGFSKEDVENITDEQYDEEIVNIISAVKATAKENDVEIPVAVAGGVYDRSDFDHYMELGADAVQVATRFVTTEECDASDAYKQAYIDAKKEDIAIIKSPVGMPGRAIHNEFIDRVANGERFINGCMQCIKMCKPAEIPFCITQALINAVEGRINEGLVFCGSNAYRATKIETVAQIMEEFA